jgi:hypothetical protein
MPDSMKKLLTLETLIFDKNKFITLKFKIPTKLKHLAFDLNQI